MLIAVQTPILSMASIILTLGIDTPQVLVESLVAGAGWQTIIQYSRAVARPLFQCLSNQTQTRKDYTVLPNTIYWTINKHINIYRTNQNQHELEKLALNLHRLAAVPSVLESL